MLYVCSMSNPASDFLTYDIGFDDQWYLGNLRFGFETIIRLNVLGEITHMSAKTSSRQAIQTGHLDALALGGAAATVSAAVTLLLGVFETVGIYEGAMAVSTDPVD